MLAVDDAILDGEVIAADETGRPQFYDLLRRPEGTRLCSLRHSVANRCRPSLFAARRAPEASASDFAAKFTSDNFGGSLGRGKRPCTL